MVAHGSANLDGEAADLARVRDEVAFTRVQAGTRRNGGEKWCDECGAEARLIALEDAAALLRVQTDTVLRWASEARLHVIEAGGSVSICLTSLSQGRTPSAVIEMRETDGGAFHA